MKQRYGTELRSMTLASIRPEISQALNTLVEELQSSEDAKVMRTIANTYSKNKMSPNVNINRNRFPSCPICKTTGRPNNHFLSKCTYLPPEYKKYLMKARQISEVYDVPLYSDEDDSSRYSMNTQSEPTSPGPSRSNTCRVTYCKFCSD